jgi:hypothetical protein
MSYPAKTADPLGEWTWGSARLKAYVLARDPSAVSEDTVKQAKDALATSLEPPTAPDEVGFVIVHRCGRGHLLLACTWREENELWETVWSDDSGRFERTERGPGHLPTYCVWEMGIVSHETACWRRALDSGLTTDARAAYLSHAFRGQV